ncbi:MAG: hypothetical protein COX62_01400 [Deltaproteobacteria bacterium CG_4_10_14_0_2_um_filter_43_8]|nr:MAG: hypothetical protein COV43_04440 [Deltaproteobacteria bacterium CG11_big_fil_rev_8_21_14_0_20_42_23]PJA21808.1 MAG: hypothetical protein COX62_01400 [Deltaproteobacteria bacterium CG_4_10_14_0_2_um_filter_43_8]PJC65023.1 MAG: hypothetical protein CO021_00830 [Deltaproteobacteria bacterium CG_4_9_14_0_2_um_filter_42_21]
MPFNRPLLPSIVTRVQNDIREGLGIASILRRSVEDAIAKAIAGVSHMLHGHLDWLSRQLIPDTAEDEFLERWASVWGLSKKAATFARVEVKFTGDVGSIIPQNTIIRRSDNVDYQTDAEGEIPAGVVGAQEITDFTTLADVGGSLDGTYFILYDADGSAGVWIDIDNSGTPAPVQALQQDRNVEITTINANDDDATVAAKIAAVLDVDDAWSANAIANVLTITDAQNGVREDANPGDTFFIINVTQQGVDEVIEGEIIVEATAVVAAENGNVVDGSILQLVAPIVGVDANVTVNDTIQEAEDQETIEQLRERLLQRIQQPPAGGAVRDYVAWGLSIAGITRVWVGPGWFGLGTVAVFVVEDGETNIIPDAAKVQEVQDYIDTVRPITADVIVFPPTPAPLDFMIALQPNTQAVRDAVTQELKDLIARDAQVVGTFKTPNLIHDGTILLSRINEAISLAVGEEDHNLLAPVVNFQPNAGEIAVLGTITWQNL